MCFLWRTGHIDTMTFSLSVFRAILTQRLRRNCISGHSDPEMWCARFWELNSALPPLSGTCCSRSPQWDQDMCSLWDRISCHLREGTWWCAFSGKGICRTGKQKRRKMRVCSFPHPCIVSRMRMYRVSLPRALLLSLHSLLLQWKYLCSFPDVPCSYDFSL